MSQELVIPGFRGVQRLADQAELEKSPPESLYLGDNICHDQQGNVYVTTGYKVFTDAFTVANVHSVYYSSAIQKLICVGSNGDLFTVNPVDGSIFAPAGGSGIISTSKINDVTYADWYQTNSCFISDGIVYLELNDVGTLTDQTAVAGSLGPGKILIAHKNTMFSIKEGIKINPSAKDNPLSFSSTDEIKLEEDGKTINAASILNGILRIHKQNTVYTIIGDLFAGAEKDLQIINLRTSKGALYHRGIYVHESVEYAVCIDGFYAFRENAAPQKISTVIDGLLPRFWYVLPNTTEIVSFIPMYGPDVGTKYLLFATRFSPDNRNIMWKYAIEKNIWTHEHDLPHSPTSLAFSRDHMKVFFGAAEASFGRIFVFDNVALRYLTSIRGNLITNPIDKGTRARIKLDNWLSVLNEDYTGLKVFGGVDGLYPLFDLSSYVESNNSVAEIPLREFGGIFTQYRFEKTGGGSPLVGGLSLLYNEVSQHQRNSTATSRLQAVEFMMRYAPLLKTGKITTVNGTIAYTVTHGLNEKPETIYVCQGDGLTYNNFIRITDLNRTSFTVLCPSNPGADKTIYWLVVAPGKRLFDSYFRGCQENFNVGTVSQTVNHNLDVLPDAILISKQGNPEKAMTISGFEERQLYLVPQAGHTTTLLFVTVLKSSGATKDDYFRCGSTASSPINHGLGVVPDAAFIYPNQNPIPTFGITSLSSTQIVYSGTGSYYWAAFKALGADTGIGIKPLVI